MDLLTPANQLLDLQLGFDFKRKNPSYSLAVGYLLNFWIGFFGEEVGRSVRRRLRLREAAEQLRMVVAESNKAVLFRCVGEESGQGYFCNKVYLSLPGSLSLFAALYFGVLFAKKEITPSTAFKNPII